MTTVRANHLDLLTAAVVERYRKRGWHQCLQKSLSFVFRLDVHRMTTISPFEKVLLLVSSQSYNRGMLQFWEP